MDIKGRLESPRIYGKGRGTEKLIKEKGLEFRKKIREGGRE